MQAPGRLLPPEFFLPPPEEVAPALLGKLLVRRDADGALRVGRIVETEAYLGADDAAAHAYRGRTARTEVLFGPPGRAYVYLIYGLHYCLNVSCQPEGEAGCVLFRAVEPLFGIEAMRASRALRDGAPDSAIASGPARLCQAFEITRPHDNGKNMTVAASDLQLRDDGYVCCDIMRGVRVGITKAAELPLRFRLLEK